MTPQQAADAIDPRGAVGKSTDLERGIRMGLEMAARTIETTAAKVRRQQDRHPGQAKYRHAKIEWCASLAMRMRHIAQQSEKRPEVLP